MTSSKGTFSHRLNLAKLYESDENYGRSLYEEPEENPETNILLSNKLKTGKIRGYLDYHHTGDMLNSIQEQFVKINQQDLESKKVIKPGFEKDNVPVKKQINTKGKGWFNFPENESQEVEKDYLVIQLRNAIDPKRFYKKPEHKSKIPKFVQIGKVVTDPHDFYDRATKAERKPTLVEELLADIESKKKIKKRFLAVKPVIATKRQRKAVIKKYRKNDKSRRNKSRNNK